MGALMVSLDALVVAAALATIHRDTHASLSQLQWTTNGALTLGAVLLAGFVVRDFRPCPRIRRLRSIGTCDELNSFVRSWRMPAASGLRRGADEPAAGHHPQPDQP